jgi:hypothetical protein
MRGSIGRLAALAVVLAGSLAAVPTADALTPPNRYAGTAAALGPGVPTTSTAAPERRARERVRSQDFAPAGRAAITPGIQMYTAGAQCTGNFVFTDAVGGVYVGYSAHCAGLGAATDTNGCNVRSQPLGTRVDFVRGGSLLASGTRVGGGTLVYSSWIAMDKANTTDVPTCAFNDFALVKVDAKDEDKVNPSVPFYGGPTGIDRNGTGAGETVYSYGNSSLRAGIEALSPKLGLALGDVPADDGWSHGVYTLTPGVPGDSGSGFMTAGGKAVGTLSTVAIAPLPLSNQTGDLLRELRFARANSDIQGLRLAKGTVPFSSTL